MKASEHCTVAAVASRSIDKAREWISQQQLSADDVKAYGSYGELLEDPNVDAVYIPLPSSLHYEWAMKSARAKKHILCEKPVTPTLAQLQEILAECDANGVMFMDGVFWSHQPRTLHIANAIQQHNLIGRPVHVNAVFTWRQDNENIRINPEVEPLGAVGDLGWYTIRAALFGFNQDMPDSVQGIIRWTNKPAGRCLSSANGLLSYQDGRTASIFCSFDAAERQTFEIQGTDATVRVESFVWAQKEGQEAVYTVQPHLEPARQVELDRAETDWSVRGRSFWMVDKFSQLVLEGGQDRFWSQLSLKTQTIMNALVDNATHLG
eukprot:TRINITY_DN1777_c0_g1_i3.p1 TRINITY_DN1777_c0_g1~~TRINITY_DN1777_c0_g1_i3.p1  ORF type:complete len:321 (+),score=103.35 TRINITY_DN1777_c0_g1_i3:112-1074(+)